MTSEPSQTEARVTRPTACPECNGKAIDTLAKVFTAHTTWRCCRCQKTWTIASQSASARPRR